MGLQYNIWFGVSAVIYMVILVVYLRISYSMESKRNHEFFKVAIYVLLADAFDVITAITISYGSAIPSFLNIILNTCYFVLNALLSYQFLRYSQLCVKGVQGELKVAFGYRAIIYVYMGLLAANMLTGWMFGFDEQGMYIHGPLYYLLPVVPYSCFFMGVYEWFVIQKNMIYVRRFPFLHFRYWHYPVR